jgi:quinolinate synthase
MAMNGLRNLVRVLEQGDNEVLVDPDTGARAYRCIDRMLAFAAARNARVRPGPDLAREQALFAGIGPA